MGKADTELVDRDRFTIVSFDDAPDAATTGMIKMPYHCSEATARNLARLHQAEGGEGVSAKVLFRQSGERPMSATHVTAKPGRTFVRHSHSVDCLYVVIGGELIMGRRVLRRGDTFFIPANAMYTYRAGESGSEVIEFRTEKDYETHIADNSEEVWDAVVENARRRRADWIASAKRSTVET